MIPYYILSLLFFILLLLGFIFHTFGTIKDCLEEPEQERLDYVYNVDEYKDRLDVFYDLLLQRYPDGKSNHSFIISVVYYYNLGFTCADLCQFNEHLSIAIEDLSTVKTSIL